ncbi:MAG: biopolymer transporter ExbD [Zoogloeaceae bacterium]|jgi:biopolymer transport protein TolR|nr:biopolymer transporter ExbD [Zoogloeaceae bacterium]
MRQRRLKNEINVVPYIDVMLVLLVIFMVAAPMMQTGSVDLPSVEKASAVPENPLRVEVGADGALKFVDKSGARAVDEAELAALLTAAQAQIPQPAVLVAGDKAARYEAVLLVLDTVKSKGFTRVGLETARK